jgi:hypothetical protein
VVEASGLTGEFVTFENVGVKIWIPEGMTAVEADQLPENNIGYFQAEDGSAVSVAYVDMGGMELSEYANQVAALGIEGIETGKLNGLDCVTYENANEDGSVNLVASFATQMGYILEVAVGPVATDDAKTGAHDLRHRTGRAAPRDERYLLRPDPRLSGSGGQRRS